MSKWEDKILKATIESIESHSKENGLSPEVDTAENNTILQAIYKFKSGTLYVGNNGEIGMEYHKGGKEGGRSIFFHISKPRLKEFDVFADMVPAVNISYSIPQKGGWTSSMIHTNELDVNIHQWMDNLDLS